ncbi:MAG TPA: WecB/TagA/CpsF family glycosyltransferase [Geminicoccus sp.]|jgi:exopolysaccharide biosynthesis WecB/TagA/CpsF family protein|uniref:WecB/TagA/CpsF family glycosyltransferase n=1 Tax=Geminicoccus sp. TaxID=2024832 RepID=UPI002E324787|nr:WecB/TagA/CpsF family glycosyltransferase [Geminicoccus sp.]HEX2526153.1 WecB/TagA/CpsF family glycosyltransferase [Geminicoccus sp.]
MKLGELAAMVDTTVQPGRARPLKQKFCEMPFTGVGVRDVLRYLDMRTVNDPFTYIVTPNVDHVVRNWRDKGELVEIYEDAELSLCDSRIVSLIGRFSGVSLPVVTGSDLTAILLEYTIDPQERITIIGGSAEVVAKLARRYGLRDIRHHNPPMGFIRDPAAVMEAAQFVERNPSRFVFLAVGSPQQEILARAIKHRGQATGIGLCVGASLLFLTGNLQRAPLWMQRAKLEWLHRLAQEPRRMWRRYLYDAPKILRIAADHQREQRVLVSVIVPTDRHEELLPRLIERCGAQTGFNADAIEIVFVDYSAEGSARAIVERHATRSRVRIRYLHSRGIGMVRARNLAATEAKGEFLAFITECTLPTPSWLEAMLKVHRIYDADVVLGPVEPVFETEPASYGSHYRRAFAYRSDATTGTALEPRRPLQFTGGGSFVPFATRNAMMLKANYAAMSSAGSDDSVFLARLLRSGKRLVWCAEATVEEQIPAGQLRPMVLLRRVFRQSQLTAGTAMADPPSYGDLLGWIGIGLLQTAAGSARALLWPISRERGMSGLHSLAAGLGKLAFLGGSHARKPVPAVIVEPPAPQPDPVAAPGKETVILETFKSGPSRVSRRWWRRRAPTAA